MKRRFCLLIFAITVLAAFSIYIKTNTPDHREAFAVDILLCDKNLVFIENTEQEFIPTFNNISQVTTMDMVQKYLFTIDKAAYVTESDLDIEKLTNLDLKLNLQGSEPKILIFHTHSKEDFMDSEEGNPDDTIVGVGAHLADILAKDYGITVVHDKGMYDFVDGKLVRGESYENMEPAVAKILEKYPSIEVTIDLHRDGVPDNVHLVTDIDGKPTAKLMYFNGITRYNNSGVPQSMPELENPYLEENLALSLQLLLTTNEKYPGLARKNYIKPYRYSLHLKPRSMLVEAGANTNTVEEVMNAMYPLADVIVEVLE